MARNGEFPSALGDRPDGGWTVAAADARLAELVEPGEVNVAGSVVVADAQVALGGLPPAAAALAQSMDRRW